MRDQRPFDVTVVGASGVTGREVVRQLRERALVRPLRWRVAGRDVAKLRRTLEEAGVDVPVVELDLTVPRALRQVVESTRVVVNTVGPYARFSTLVPMSCAVVGTHYVDVCADLDVVGRMIDECNSSAVASGASLVHTAGFLALPFDLVTARAARHSHEAWGSPLAEVDVAILVSTGGRPINPGDLLSGGTLSEGAEALRRGPTAATTDARCLVRSPHEPLTVDTAPREHPGTGRWLGPLLLAPYVNPAIVHRSISSGAVTEVAAGFRYREGLTTVELIPGISPSLSAIWMAGAHAMTTLVGSSHSLLRNLVADAMQALGPRPGTGPSGDALSSWRWRLDCAARTTSGQAFTIVTEGAGHVGYRASANLVAEAAMVLATTEHARGGVLTPAMAFGDDATPFEAAGMRMHPVTAE